MRPKIEPVLGLSNPTNLRTGIATVDSQHLTLLAKLQAIQEHLMGGQNPPDAHHDALFLAEYALEHFADEERLMVEAGYPDLDAHREEHRRFSEWTEVLKKRLALGGDHRSILEEVHLELSEWLVGHIRTSDREMARHLAAS